MSQLGRSARASSLVLLVLTSAFVRGADAAPARCHFRQRSSAKGTWTTIPTPTLDSSALRDPHRPDRYAVDAGHPSTMFVADAWSIQGSNDGGCTWEEQLDVADLPVPDLGTGEVNVLSVDAPLSSGAPRRSYALIDAAGRPLVGVHEGSSGTWRVEPFVTRDDGAPLVGHPVDLWVAPSDARVLYMTVTDPVGPGRTRAGQAWGPTLSLYRSADAGETWSPTSSSLSVPFGDEPPLWPFTGDTTCAAGPDRCALLPPWRMAIDPLDENALWTANSTGIFASRDGGITWKNVYPADSQVLGPVQAITVSHARESGARVVVFGLYRSAWSDDGGMTWELRDPPRGYDSTGRKADASYLDSAVAGAGERTLVAMDRSGSYGGANVQMLTRTGESAIVSPEGLHCEVEDPNECVTQLAYARRSRSFYGITSSGTDLMAFRPRS